MIDVSKESEIILLFLNNSLFRKSIIVLFGCDILFARFAIIIGVKRPFVAINCSFTLGVAEPKMSCAWQSLATYVATAMA